jgi:hypothetical protein
MFILRNLIILMDVNENKPKYNMIKKLGEGTYGKAYLVDNSKDKVQEIGYVRIFM